MHANARAADEDRLSLALLALLAFLSAVGPLATDLYLPGFPRISAELAAAPLLVQLTLTSFFIGMAAGQLVFGPLSDRLGRRVPLLIGVAVSILAGAVAALSPDIGVLVAARCVQGFASAAGVVLGRAIIADLAEGRAAIRAFSLLNVVFGLAPVIAPFFGGFLIESIGWRGVLWVIVALGVVSLGLSIPFVPETLPAAVRRQRAAQAHSRFPWRVLGSRAFLGFTLTGTFSFTVLFAYLAAGSFVYQDMMGFSPLGFGIAFGVTALGSMGASALAAKMSTTVRPTRVIGAGIAIQVVAGLVLLALVLSGASPLSYIPCFFFAVSAMSLVLGNAIALALNPLREAAGTGSALIGFIQFAVAALAQPLVGIAGAGSALPMALVMACAAVLALVAFLLSRSAASIR